MSRFARRRGGEEQRATSLELFYDLVFVVVLVTVIAAEQVSGTRRGARGELSPLERLEVSAAGPGGEA